MSSRLVKAQRCASCGGPIERLELVEWDEPLGSLVHAACWSGKGI